MKAITQREYGPPDRLIFEDVDPPTIGPDQVLVRMKAAGVNPWDWHMMTGKPWMVRLVNGLRSPKAPPGADGAGIVEEVGSNVAGLSPGDEVWGSLRGAYAEYAVGSERNLVRKPSSVSFEQAAATPIAAVTALQGLRDHGGLEAGQQVLINGASGGVGTFAVMIAKAMGAHVTGVCSTRNLELVRSIGADEVIDYTTTDYTEEVERYDLILDNVSTRGIRANRRSLVDGGVHVQVGMLNKNSSIRLLVGQVRRKLANVWSSKELRGFTARIHKQDLEVINGHLDSGAVVPVIDRTFSLGDTAQALRYFGEGHTRGKNVITI